MGLFLGLFLTICVILDHLGQFWITSDNLGPKIWSPNEALMFFATLVMMKVMMVIMMTRLMMMVMTKKHLLHPSLLLLPPFSSHRPAWIFRHNIVKYFTTLLLNILIYYLSIFCHNIPSSPPHHPWLCCTLMEHCHWPTLNNLNRKFVIRPYPFQK